MENYLIIKVDILLKEADIILEERIYVVLSKRQSSDFQDASQCDVTFQYSWLTLKQIINELFVSGIPYISSKELRTLYITVPTSVWCSG